MHLLYFYKIIFQLSWTVDIVYNFIYKLQPNEVLLLLSDRRLSLTRIS